MDVEPVSFYSEGRKLLGNLHIPFKGAPCITLLHGLEGHKDSDKWITVASRLSMEGYASLRFNFRGCGEGSEKSEGSFEDTNLTARIRDYKAALDFLESSGKVCIKKLGAIGSSFGGMVAIAAQETRIKALVTLATPYRISRNSKIINQSKDGEYYVLPSGRKLKKSFFDDLEKYNMLELIKKTPPILIIHGKSDDIVPVEHAYKLYKSAAEPKKLEIIENADHTFSTALERVMNLSLQWFRRCLV